MKITDHARRDDRGAAAVELALVLPILLLLVLGIVQFGMVFSQWLEMEHAAREGARWGSLGYSVTQIEQKVQAAAPGLNWSAPTSRITVTPAVPAASQGQPCAVTISYSVSILPIMGSVFGDPKATSMTLTARAVQLIE